MSENKEIEKLTGYHREAAKMAVFTSTVSSRTAVSLQKNS